MITEVEIIKALSGLIETITGSPPTTKDITEGFERPCSWIRPLDIQPEAVRGLQRDYLEIEIVYFAPQSWQGWKQLLQVRSALTNALREPVPISDTFAIYPEDLDFVPIRDDMSLTCTFSLENYQLIPPTQDEIDRPNMEHLHQMLNGLELVDPPEE